jgi:hypothetical protein
MNNTYCFSTTTTVARTGHTVLYRTVPYCTLPVLLLVTKNPHFILLLSKRALTLLQSTGSNRLGWGHRAEGRGMINSFLCRHVIRQRLLQHTVLIKGRVTRPAILRRCLQLLSREVTHHRAPFGRRPFRLHQGSETPFHHFSLSDKECGPAHCWTIPPYNIFLVTGRQVKKYLDGDVKYTSAGFFFFV